MMLLGIFFVVPVLIIVGFVCYCALGIIKFHRCNKWYEAHGVQVGSDEWGQWCIENNVSPSYFI